MFINTIPTRVQTPSGQDTLTWLRDLQVRQSQSREFDFASLSQLQSWSDLPPGANLFDSMIVFENYPYNENSATQAGLHIRDVQAHDATNFPLTPVAYLAGQLHINLTYDPQLFDTATVEQMAGHLQVILAAIAADPGRLVGAVPLLTPAEQAQVLTEWNDTARPFTPATAGELFTARAGRTPDAPAVVWDGGQLTYAELDAAANRLARQLTGLGAGREDWIGLPYRSSRSLRSSRPAPPTCPSIPAPRPGGCASSSPRPAPA
jgi:non-ribosomal peptide synthetase component F